MTDNALTSPPAGLLWVGPAPSHAGPAHARGSTACAPQAELVRHVPSGGPGGAAALEFSARDRGWLEDEYTAPAARNVPYAPTGFGGTVAMWVRCRPDHDLHPEFPVDLFHVSRHPADGALWLDLTRPGDERYGAPRKLRFGMYADSAVRDKLYNGRLIIVGDLGWEDGAWHHVAATWENFNTGETNARAALYLDGRRRGFMENFAIRITWDLDRLRFGLGQRYVGGLSGIEIHDRPLTANEIQQLAQI